MSSKLFRSERWFDTVDAEVIRSDNPSSNGSAIGEVAVDGAFGHPCCGGGSRVW